MLGGIETCLNTGLIVGCGVRLAPVIVNIKATCRGSKAFDNTLNRSGIIKVTNRFAMIITAATGGIMMVYIASMVLGMFGVGIPLIHSSGPMGIGFSLFVVAIASFSLTLDFEFIVQGERNNLPRYMEWYAGFALLVTLVWLYLEILRLLSKLQRD